MYGDTENYINKNHQVPGIIFNTLPKSGSVYISKTLSRSLDIEYRNINLAHGYFPNYFLIARELSRITKGNVIRQEHFDASPINIKILLRYVDRIIVHLRDPRQATLSWLHHVNRLLKESPEDSVNYTIHTPPNGYLEWSIEKQLDWHIETHLRTVVEWINDWVNYVDNGGTLKVHFSSYEDLVSNEDSFMKNLLDFYSIPHNLFRHTPAEKIIDNNYRKGEKNEWVEVYSEKQKQEAKSIIGADLLNRFNWNQN